MGSGFDARRDSVVVRRATLAFANSFLDDVLTDMRLAARGCGYALAVHGSLARDIDMIAIPWVDGADNPEVLIQRLCGVLSGKLGRSVYPSEKPSSKPHGRIAVTLFSTGMLTPEIDLSVMPVQTEVEYP